MTKIVNKVSEYYFYIIELSVFYTDNMCNSEYIVMYFIQIIFIVGAKLEKTTYQEDYSIVIIKGSVITLHPPECFKSISYEDNPLLYSVSRSYIPSNSFRNIPKTWLDIDRCVVKLDYSKLLKNNGYGLKLLEIKSKLGDFYETLGILFQIYIIYSFK